MFHLFKAGKTLIRPEYRKYILVPLVVNFILFIILTGALITLFSDVMTVLLDYVPNWLHFMAWLVWLVFGLAILIVYGLSFTFITNIIAAPFNGLLAEKIQRDNGIELPDNESMQQTIVRTLWREIIKLTYFIAYGLLVTLALALISFIPLVNLAVPVLAFMWSSWCIAIQYLDYAADNCQQDFHQLRKDALKTKLNTFSFGGMTSVLTMIPMVNIFVMPLAVVAGTEIWIKHIHSQELQRNR